MIVFIISVYFHINILMITLTKCKLYYSCLNLTPLFIVHPCSTLVAGDSICGVSVSIRNYDDIIQLWNEDANLAQHSTLEQAIKDLVPGVKFKAVYYKC